MSITLIALVIAVFCASVVIWIKYRRNRAQRELERHSITPDALHALLASKQGPLLFDVRLPLDLLVDSEIIPGAKRIEPKEVIANPSVIPRDKDSVVYCTCPSDETSRRVLRQALDLGFFRAKFLKGGLAGWKAKGYPVQPYNESFQLDTRS